jgi:hypothetical protein
MLNGGGRGRGVQIMEETILVLIEVLWVAGCIIGSKRALQKIVISKLALIIT